MQSSGVKVNPTAPALTHGLVETKVSNSGETCIPVLPYKLKSLLDTSVPRVLVTTCGFLTQNLDTDSHKRCASQSRTALKRHALATYCLKFLNLAP